MLDYFSVDTRIKVIEEQYNKWTDNPNINAEGRLRLAETFAVMEKSSKALDQIKKTWEQRDKVISSATISYTEVRTRKELLLAARMSFSLGQYSETQDFLEKILELWPASNEGKIAHKEMLKVLNELNKFKELKAFALKHSGIIEKDLDYYAISARCYWELKEYRNSANAWKNAFMKNKENGVFAANAANALELAGNREKALSLFLTAGKIFLNQDNNAELEVIIPKLSTLGSNDWEARALIGKWAFGIGDYNRCEAEFAAAEKNRRAIKPRPKEDPALNYLRGLVYNIKGKNDVAVRLLEKAVKLAPDYGLFRFKLAEIKAANGIDDPNLFKELKRAVDSFDDDMKAEMAKQAGKLLLKAGDAENARYFLSIKDSAASKGQAKK
jgi:tetratricopeptide (TPR) repeat protein